MPEAPPLTFTGAELDRAPERRGRPEWLAEQLRDPGARALLLSEDGAWAWREDGGARLALVEPGPLGGEPLLLGLADGRPLFALDVDGLERDGLPGEPLGLRELAALLPERETGLAAYAAALLNWHRRHRFCSNCGQPTEVVDAGHERRCPACGASHFPRTDPVVIVRVTDGERLLLGHQARWPEGRYSVLAGFVEPGETLEQAVRREVAEESGVVVGEVGYVASQPWPFPSSLMLGFEARALRGEPQADGEELADVRWFGPEQIVAAARGEGEILLPPPFSIARRLIDGWLGEESAERGRRHWESSP